MPINLVWAIIWLLGGLIVFQITPVKKFLTVVSLIFTVLGALSYGLDQPMLIIGRFGVDYMSGMLTVPFYRLGANISRYIQFRKISLWRISIYLVAIIVIVLVF